MSNALDRCDKRYLISMTSVWVDGKVLLVDATGERDGTRFIYLRDLCAVLMPIFTGFRALVWLSLELLPRAE